VSQIREVIGAEQWSKALLAEGAEQWPSDGVGIANVTLQHVVPMLGDTGHVEGGKTDFVVLVSLLSTKEVLAVVQPAQWIFL
jgi:hypothetical protein